MKCCIKKLCCKLSIVFPLTMIYILLMDPFTISIVELGIYWGYSLTIMFFITVTIVWLCCSPFRESCCNGTWTEVLFNLVPVEILLVFVFTQWHFQVSIFLFIIFMVTDTIYIVASRNDEKRHKHSKRMHLLYKSAFKKFTILALFIIYIIPCLMVVFIYNFRSPAYRADEKIWDRLFSEVNDAGAEKAEQKDLYQDNITLLLCFACNSWNKYTINEKITIMQELVDLEANSLGIPTIPITAELLIGSTLGQYSNESKEIWIDVEHLSKAPVDKCIQTICHEVFHAYQHYLVDNLDWENDVLNCPYFTELRLWKDNQENYKNIWTSGYDAYENQPLEVAARNFAEQETQKILSYVN